MSAPAEEKKDEATATATTATTATATTTTTTPTATSSATTTDAAAEKEDEGAGAEETGEGGGDGPHFEPLVSLPEVAVKDGEEDEDVLFKMRSKLFRFDAALKEWKERGTGNVRFLKHKQTNKIRLLMRRERTLKVCANHLIISLMKLEANAGSDRSWVYTCPADVTDGAPTKELFAIRFANSDDAKAFKTQFEAAQVENEKILAAEAKK